MKITGSRGLLRGVGALPLGALFALLVLIPLVLTLMLSFHQYDYQQGILPGYTVEHYLTIVTDDYFLRIFWRTLWISVVTTLLCVLIGGPEAYILSRMRRPWNSVFLLLVLSPLLVSLVVRAFGWTILLNPAGVLGQLAGWLGFGRLMYTPTAVIIALVHVMLPFMVIPVWTSLQKADPSAEQAAYSLGASRARVFWQIVAPQALPGVLSGSLIVFGLTASSFAIPALLGGSRQKMAASVVYDQFLIQLNWPLGAAIAMLLLVANVLIMMSYGRLVEGVYKRSLG
ncbi:ABC transporter permease [Castellaniella hirudinis]|uniref:ABC transporter permease n=1 Tax=Castellaniella hirudinis TaxID=1144617 RepID=UPI0039C1D80F